MLLLNTSTKTLETKFDGQLVIIKPGEKKILLDRVQAEHVLFKLMDYGLVEIPDRTEVHEAAPDSELMAPFYVKGLQMRRKYLNNVVQNFRTMNKEREAAKLSSEQPSDFIVECVKEIRDTDTKLAALRADDLSIVEKYLSTTESADAAVDIEKNLAGAVAVDPKTGAFKVTGKGSLAEGVELPPAKETEIKAKGQRKTQKV